MNIAEQNEAIFGLLRAYKMLKETNVYTNNPVETKKIEDSICKIFGWPTTLSTDAFKKNLGIIYELVGL